MTILSSDIPRIQARDVKHANENNRRITEWKKILQKEFPYYSNDDILRLACSYVAEEDYQAEKTK